MIFDDNVITVYSSCYVISMIQKCTSFSLDVEEVIVSVYGADSIV